jgi:hypothetical protein
MKGESEAQSKIDQAAEELVVTEKKPHWEGLRARYSQVLATPGVMARAMEVLQHSPARHVAPLLLLPSSLEELRQSYRM